MMGNMFDRDQLWVEQRRLHEMRARADQARQARLVRGKGPVRRQVGGLLIAAGEALIR